MLAGSLRLIVVEKKSRDFKRSSPPEDTGAHNLQKAHVLAQELGETCRWTLIHHAARDQGKNAQRQTEIPEIGWDSINQRREGDRCFAPESRLRAGRLRRQGRKVYWMRRG